MKTTVMILGFALFTTIGAQAQTTPGTMAPGPKGDKHSCIMAGTDVWTSLGLSAEQTTEVKNLQASCKSEYDAAKGDASVSVAKHEEKLKGILTTEQYTKWSQWCTEASATKPRSETTK